MMGVQDLFDSELITLGALSLDILESVMGISDSHSIFTFQCSFLSTLVNIIKEITYLKM